MKNFSLDAANFNLAHTLECGQVFRWDKIAPGEYLGVIGGAIVIVRQEKDRLYVRASDKSITSAFIKSYLDLALDLPYIYNKIGQDKHIKAAITRFYGLRIIRQPLWECLASFIISAYNNIPRIKGIVYKLSRCFGRGVRLDDTTENYSFPGAGVFNRLRLDQIRRCGAGFRARFLKKTAKTFLERKLNVETLKKLPYAKAKRELMRLSGVGEKVADCVLLYSVGRLEAFPVDVWIKRITEGIYFNGKDTSERKIREFAGDYFGEYAGYAQQYLYHYGRTMFKG